MLKPKPMKKIRIIVLKSVVEKLIKELHEAGLVDIRKSRYEGLEEGRPLASFDDVSAQLLKLRSLLSLMKANAGPVALKPKIMDWEEALEKARGLEVEPQIKSLAKEAGKLSDEIKSLESTAAAIERLLHFRDVDFSRLSTKTITFRAGEVSGSKIPALAKELEDAEGEVSFIRDPNSDTIIVFCEREKEASFDSILSEYGFTPIEIPEGLTKPAETIDIVREDYESRKARLEQVKSELASLSKQHINEVFSLEESLEIEAERGSVSRKFSSSKSLYIIEGWIPEEDFGKLSKIVEKTDAVLQQASFSHGEMPPTVLDNPAPASPFEFLTKSYSMPNYFEIDPTMMYFIGLPIIYGMIVGDFLYGVISVALGYLLMQKFKSSYTMYNVSKIWFYSGFPTMLFGIIFDEWGGMSHVALLNYLGGWVGLQVLAGPLYHGFHRMENILGLVALSAIVGLLHLGAGFVLGAVNEWHHNRKHAYAKIAWLGVEVAIVLVLAGMIGGLPTTIPGLVLLVACVITLAFTEGVVGIIELPGLLGNILSYTRIAAIGIVGIVIAELLNEFIIPVPEQGILALIFLPIYFVLHVVNAFIAMFESLVQGGRLNIVEFRSKFLHGGGEIFTPFKMR